MVIESNIHHPNDSSLLGDCVRVFTRLMKRSNEKFGLNFQSRRLRAKRRVLDISNAKSMKERTPLYRDPEIEHLARNHVWHSRGLLGGCRGRLQHSRRDRTDVRRRLDAGAGRGQSGFL
jgi:hypothetical protein